MFGRKVIDSIQLEEKTARECPEKEPFYPYESNIRIFMIDNNKCPMYCCAIVYDMPHRIKTEKKKAEPLGTDFWESLLSNHLTRLIQTNANHKGSGQKTLAKSATYLLAHSTTDDLVYLPHATVLMTKERPKFDLLVPALQIYYNYVIYPCLSGIPNNYVDLSGAFEKISDIVDSSSTCSLTIKEQRYVLADTKTRAPETYTRVH